MIEYVGCVDTNCDELTLGNSNAFLESHIGFPGGEAGKVVLPQCAGVTGKRSLQHDLASGRKLYRIQCTLRRKGCRHQAGIAALRIPCKRIKRLAIGPREQVALLCSVRPGE